jgi:hypothetical protein
MLAIGFYELSVKPGTGLATEGATVDFKFQPAPEIGD